MDTKDILPKEKLEDLYLIKKFSDNKIAKQFNLTLGQVHRLRNIYKIKTLEQYERHPINELSEYEKSLIIGLMLGDGHIRKRRGKKTYPQLMIEQSVIHKKYVYWLKEQLKNWLYNEEKPITTNRKKNKNGKVYHSLSFQTVCHPVFNEIYEDFYKSGKKILGRKTLEKYFSLISLAVWIMDDGTLTGNAKRNILATNNFSLDDVKFLQNFLKEKFELKSWICRRTTTSTITWELAFDKKSSIKISEMLQNLVIDSMKYKLLSETTKDAG